MKEGSRMQLQGKYTFKVVIFNRFYISRTSLLQFSPFYGRLVDRSDGSPAWGDAGVIMTWLMYKMYGDTQLIEDQYEPMQKWLHYIGANNSDYIWRNRLNHNYGDWLNVNAQTPKEVVSTAFYAYDALLLSYMAKAINKTADAQKYEQLHKNIADAFNKNFVDQTTGKIINHTQCDYVLALAFKLLPDALIPKAVKHLVEAVKARDWHLSTGFIGRFKNIQQLAADYFFYGERASRPLRQMTAKYFKFLGSFIQL